MTRRPLNGARRITGDTATHATYGVGPATDYGADRGEPVFAPYTGWVTRWWSPTGGNSVAITSDTRKFTGQHLDGYAGASSGRVAEGAIIGYIGSTGSASSGPHLHCWDEAVNGGGRKAFEERLVDLGWKNTAPAGGSVPGPYQTSTASSGLTPFPEEEETMQILKNKNDTSIHSSHFLWGGGIAPEVISNSTAEIYKDAGIKVHETTRDRWLWLLEHETKRAQTSTPVSGGGNVAVDLKLVLDAVAAIPAAVRTNLIKE